MREQGAKKKIKTFLLAHLGQVITSHQIRDAAGTTEKPTVLWLLSQIRRAGQDEQRAVFDWLKKKFSS